MKKSEIKKWVIGKLKKKEIKEEFIKEITTNVPNTQLEELDDVNEIWNKIKKELNKAAGKK